MPQTNVAAPSPNPEPLTPAQRRSLNSFKHGLTARKFVFSPEESEAYAAHFAAIEAHYKPADPVEAALVRQIAHGIWALDHAAAVEHGVFALAFESLPAGATETDEALAPARAWLAQGKDLALLSLYVKRIQNKLDRDKSELTRTRKERAQQAEKQAKEAAKPDVYELQPDPDGRRITVKIAPDDAAGHVLFNELTRMEAFLAAQSSGAIASFDDAALPADDEPLEGAA